ncbi:MAG: MerR family transcriptional regulator [Actinomycetota bacterium]
MADERRDAVYIISVAADLVGVHPQTLRIYERRGLLNPYRTAGGTRRYSAADLERLGLIQELTADGINIEGVKRILGMREEIRRLEKQVARLRRLLGDSEQRHIAGTVPRAARARVTRHLPDLLRPHLDELLGP